MRYSGAWDTSYLPVGGKFGRFLVFQAFERKDHVGSGKCTRVVCLCNSNRPKLQSIKSLYYVITERRTISPPPPNTKVPIPGTVYLKIDEYQL